MESWLAKVICLVILLIITVIFGFVPRLLRSSGAEKYLSIANCVAGGVLMGTTLLHLLPEVVEDVEMGLKLNGLHVHYPIATLTVGLGFLLIVFIEMLAHTIQDKLARSARPDPVSTEIDNLPPDNFGDEEINLFDSMERVRRFTNASSKGTSDGSYRRRRKESDPEKQALLNNTIQNSRRPYNVTQNQGSGPSESRPAGHAHDGHSHQAHGMGHGPGHAHDHGPPTEMKSIGSLLLLFALSVHAILEGMAVGSEKDWLMVFTLTGALCIHKALLAFALGVKIVEEAQSLPVHIRSVACFAIASPIGVAIGVAVEIGSPDPATKKLAEGLIQAVATGTFLYIAFVEIITPELNQPDLPPLLKVVFLSIGYGIMCCVQLMPHACEDIIPPHNHTTMMPPGL